MTLTCSDGSADLVRVLTRTRHGKLTAIDRPQRRLVYAPVTGFAGTDSFTYTGNDGANDAPPATVTLSVAPAPVPKLTRLSLTKAFGAASSGPSLVARLPVAGRRGPAIGARIKFTLDRGAKVWFTVQMARAGSYVPLRGRFWTLAPAGPSHLLFTGCLHGRKLVPGSYRLLASALVAEPGAPLSPPAQTYFKILG